MTHDRKRSFDFAVPFYTETFGKHPGQRRSVLQRLARRPTAQQRRSRLSSVRASASGPRSGRDIIDTRCSRCPASAPSSASTSRCRSACAARRRTIRTGRPKRCVPLRACARARRCAAVGAQMHVLHADTRGVFVCVSSLLFLVRDRRESSAPAKRW